jgi:hypothetical protein
MFQTFKSFNTFKLFNEPISLGRLERFERLELLEPAARGNILAPFAVKSLQWRSLQKDFSRQVCVVVHGFAGSRIERHCSVANFSSVYLRLWAALTFIPIAT